MIDRQESFAASLGAKLTGPRLVKGIEKFFEGPIKTSSSQPFAIPISWIDVVLFAKASPDDFILTALPDGTRCSRFILKGTHVEITEDDWRLISSGALDRFPLEHPFEEDEAAERATLDILEQRASVLYKRADEVAARARILHHRIGHRKAILGRGCGSDEESARAQSSNNIGRLPAQAASYDLHADLLRQFTSAPSSLNLSRSTSAGESSGLHLAPVSPPVNSPRHHQHRLSNHSMRSPASLPPDSATLMAAESRGEILRGLMNLTADRLSKGDIITPSCDRCRRLRLSCVKHLTACQGCTKKHAKCSWKSVTDEEAMKIRYDLGLDTEPGWEEPSAASNLRDVHGGSQMLEGVASILGPESTSRPGSRAETDFSIPMVRSPDSINGRPVPRDVRENTLTPILNDGDKFRPPYLGGGQGDAAAQRRTLQDNFHGSTN